MYFSTVLIIFLALYICFITIMIGISPHLVILLI